MNLWSGILILVSVVVTVSGDPKKNGRCNRGVFPAAQGLQPGFNLAKMDLLAPQITATLPVIKFTCYLDQYQTINGIKYDVPDCFLPSIPLVPGSVETFTQETIGTLLDFKATVAASIEVDVFLGLASASASFGVAVERLYHQNTVITSIHSVSTAYYPQMHPITSKNRPMLDDDLQDMVSTRLDNCTSLESPGCLAAFNDLFKNYGSHYATDMCSGASLRLDMATLQAFYHSHDAAWLNIQSKNSWLFFLKVSGAFSGSVDKVDDIWANVTLFDKRVLGGTIVPPPYNAWIQNALLAPHAVPCSPGKPTVHLSSISALMPLNISSAFDRAVTNYYDHQYLASEALPLLDQFYLLLQKYDPSVNPPPECTFPNPPESQPYCARCWPADGYNTQCCSTPDIDGYNLKLMNVSKRVVQRLDTVKELRAQALALLAHPIIDSMDHTILLTLSFKIDELAVVMASPLVRVECDIYYQQNLGVCPDPHQACPFSTKNWIMSSITIPSAL